MTLCLRYRRDWQFLWYTCIYADKRFLKFKLEIGEYLIQIGTNPKVRQTKARHFPFNNIHFDGIANIARFEKER